MKKRLLVIEDNTDVRENIAEILELSDYEVFTAEHGKEGVRLAGEHIPDLIICDVMMPELDGFGVLRILSQNQQTAHIPFIFLTAKAEKTDFRKGMNLGADDYITKPFDDVELLDAIAMRLKKHELLGGKKVKESSFADAEQGAEILKSLTQDREVRHIRKKDIIYREGEYPKQVYYVKSGKLKTSKINEDGKELIVGLYGEDEFMGFLPLLQSTVYNESAVALEASEIYAIPQDDFFELIQRPSVAKYFVKHLASTVVEHEEHLLELAYNSVRKRVADALVRLKERYHNEEEEKYFTISILREDLASMVGTAKETVIRTLSDFKEEGIVDISGSRITIKKYEELVDMFN